MRIIVNTVPHLTQRYDTCGDWRFYPPDDALVILVSELGDWRKEALVAIHEIIEALLCKERGISEEAVTAFDLAHQHVDDPGMLPSAPYHREHLAAYAAELQFMIALGVDFAEYEDTILRLPTHPPKGKE